jgi:hypothetical protein
MQTKAGDAAKKKWVIGDFVVVFMCPYAPGGVSSIVLCPII